MSAKILSFIFHPLVTNGTGRLFMCCFAVCAAFPVLDQFSQVIPIEFLVSYIAQTCLLLDLLCKYFLLDCGLSAHALKNAFKEHCVCSSDGAIFHFYNYRSCFW